MIKEKYNNLRVTSKLKIKSETDYIFYKSNEEIDVTFTFSNLIFDEINGYFGNKKYLIEKEEIELEKDLLDFYNKIEGEFLFTNPSLGLTVNNSFGIPLFINLDIKASNNNNSESIIINDIEKIAHIGYSKHKDILKDTLVEWFLVSESKSIDTYSVYHWPSGFVLYPSMINDIPINIHYKL